MAVRKQKSKTTTDAHELVKKAQALSKRPKHAKNKTGFKTKSDAYLNQVPICVYHIYLVQARYLL